MLFQFEKAVEKKDHTILLSTTIAWATCTCWVLLLFFTECKNIIYTEQICFNVMNCWFYFFFGRFFCSVSIEFTLFSNLVPHRSTSICTLHQSDLDETAKKPRNRCAVIKRSPQWSLRYCWYGVKHHNINTKSSFKFYTPSRLHMNAIFDTRSWHLYRWHLDEC